MLLVVAGPNGAGKSTFVEGFLKPTQLPEQRSGPISTCFTGRCSTDGASWSRSLL
jgi:ABC-type Mn2+/Zn2+ transport system ATPase subunit